MRLFALIALAAALSAGGGAVAQPGPPAPAPGQAVPSQEQAAPETPDDPDRVRAIEAIEMAEQEGRYPEGIAILDELVARHPGERDYRWYRGVLRENVGRYAEAREDYAELVRRFPDDPEGHAGLGWIAWYLDEPAEPHFTRALELDPDNINGLTGKGLVAFDAGDRTELDRVIGRALELDAESVDALNLRALVQSADDQHDDALATATGALELAPYQSFTYLVRSIVHRRRGALPDALADMRRLALIAPASPIAAEIAELEREIGPSAADVRPTEPPARR